MTFATSEDGNARRSRRRPSEVTDPKAWFDNLYVAAERGEAVVPWDLAAPQRLLVEWAKNGSVEGAGRSALVVGCGFGRDAEYLAELGFDTVAFDISAPAVATARQRHPDSAVRYAVADLLDPPADWLEAYDLVMESMNIQALSEPVRGQAIARVGRLVAPGGTLLIISAGRSEDDEPGDGPPWPLTRAEIDAFANGDLRPETVEYLSDPQQPGVHRWRAEFRRPR